MAYYSTDPERGGRGEREREREREKVSMRESTSCHPNGYHHDCER